MQLLVIGIIIILAEIEASRLSYMNHCGSVKFLFHLEQAEVFPCMQLHIQESKLFLGCNVVRSISLDGELTVSTSVTITCYDQFGVNESYII